MLTGLLGSLLFMIFSAVSTEVSSAAESNSHQNDLLEALPPLQQGQAKLRGSKSTTALRVQLAKTWPQGTTGEINI